VVPTYKGEDQLEVENYSLVSFTFVVCIQMKHVIAGYLGQVWEMMGGYMRVNMLLDQVMHSKVN
jgi:hypothetical protein